MTAARGLTLVDRWGQAYDGAWALKAPRARETFGGAWAERRQKKQTGGGKGGKGTKGGRIAKGKGRGRGKKA